MPLSEEKVTVEVLRNGRWAQEPWLPQLQVIKGDTVNISIAIAYRLEIKGKCRIIRSPIKKRTKPAKQVRVKSEKNPADTDKKAAEG